MKVSDLVERLQNLPQGKEVLCQVVGQSSGAWNMSFDFHDVPSSWMVQLSVSHPELMDLPMHGFDKSDSTF